MPNDTRERLRKDGPGTKLVVIDAVFSKQLIAGELVTFSGFRNGNSDDDVVLKEKSGSYRPERFRLATEAELPKTLTATFPVEKPLDVGDFVVLKDDEEDGDGQVDSGQVVEIDEITRSNPDDRRGTFTISTSSKALSQYRRASPEEISRFRGNMELQVGDIAIALVDTRNVKKGQPILISEIDDVTFHWERGNYSANRFRFRPMTSEESAKREADLIARFNSGKKFTFVRGLNKFSDAPGWKPKEIPEFDPVAPDMVLHDLIEHIPGSPATPEEEFKALGAALFVRHEGGFFSRRNQRFSEQMAPAFGMLYFHAYKDRYDPKPTAVAPFSPEAHTPLPAQTEMEMVRSVALARQLVQDNRKFNGYDRDKIDASMVYAIPWMRVGYRLAQERFKDLSMPRLCEVYESAAKQMATYLNIAQEGSEMAVTFRPEQYKVDIEVSLKSQHTA